MAFGRRPKEVKNARPTSQKRDAWIDRRACAKGLRLNALVQVDRVRSAVWLEQNKN